MLPTHAVGIDLGTTYSCIAYLNEHGEPVTIPNQEGELCTPSVVMFQDGRAIVGGEALRNSIRAPERVVQHAKRHMGDPGYRWKIDGRAYSPIDISTLILKQLLDDARQRIGEVKRAVITVPAQFSDVQRQATAEAGLRAGLEHVDIINEPVAAALCYVLGTEGMWFTELTSSQLILVVDLGGGTFDLSLVRYERNAVRVVATGGDLHLGGIDWNNSLQKAIVRQFQREFGVDPASSRESLQALALEVEQVKRSLSVRSRAALTCQHAGKRKTYQVEREQFERLTRPHVDRLRELTKALLQENHMGWAHVDVVLTTGGASRMPMVREMLKQLSGRTLNTSLSPDQSIAHGAAYYAGMLLTNSQFARSILLPTAAARLQQFQQFSVNARALGILVRDMHTGERVPHYLLPANTQLPAAARQTVGTVIPNQRRAHLRVVESGTAADARFVELGTCVIDPLPENLPEGAEIEVAIRYDEQARVHVAATVKQNGQTARAEIVRPENLLVSALGSAPRDEDVAVKATSAQTVRAPQPLKFSANPAGETERTEFAPASAPAAQVPPLSTDVPIVLCPRCAEPLDEWGFCVRCAPQKSRSAGGRQGPAGTRGEASAKEIARSPALSEKSPAKGVPPVLPGNLPTRAAAEKAGEEEFWRITSQRPKRS
jgi:molecular chaperone DnaK